jgi:NTE family protein
MSAGPSPRTGLVLGAGGVLGAAWMTGALPAVQERLQRTLNDVEVIVGTSAGSVVGAALRCGISVAEMVAHQRGTAGGAIGQISLDDVADGPWPPVPRPYPGSPRLALTSFLFPLSMHPWVTASAWLPRGRGNHQALHQMVNALHGQAHAHPSAPHWVSPGDTWIVAVDYDSGRRVIFGQDGAPPATLADAVVASCSIPGWYAPAVIHGRRYVDGGVRSPHSLGILADAGLDEVWVLAPMASLEIGWTCRPQERLERRVRGLITGALLHEVRALRARGVRVNVLTPGPEDLAVMGANLMDPRRRLAVFETSLLTSAAALARADSALSAAA